MTAPGWVLVVDDEPMDRLLMCRLIERAGHQAAVADSGEGALEMLRSGEPFDLVLLDLRMPGTDGFAILDAMRADSRLRPIPVIVVSGLDEHDDVVRCMELGAYDFLEKPVDPLLVRTRVASAMERRRLRDRQVEHDALLVELADATAGAATGHLTADQGDRIDALARRPDPLGQLARALRDLTAPARRT